MVGRLWFVLLAVTVAVPAAEIPDRPEKLTFPPLTYEPPSPAQFRVPLKCGAIAYVVPDHELPLVNVSVMVRTGDYLVPAGKEGLAGLTGYVALGYVLNLEEMYMFIGSIKRRLFKSVTVLAEDSISEADKG